VTTEKEGSQPLTTDRALRLLSEGEIEVEGLIPWSSNTTLLATVRDAEISTLAIYKPLRGERPLWDFAYGTLGLREVAAYLVSEALGWELVPPTVLREGPHGPGSVQFFVHAQEDAHFFTIQDDATYADDLKRLAAFDIIANNADRKSGHCLVDDRKRLWAIDNALTFHTEYKLRTVIWDFVDHPLPDEVKVDLQSLASALQEGTSLSLTLEQLLSTTEISAFRNRIHHLIRAGQYPEPGPGHTVPWPLV
jgi:uncharacterized repeat protein (TIGR03843 family)